MWTTTRSAGAQRYVLADMVNNALDHVVNNMDVPACVYAGISPPSLDPSRLWS